MIRKYVIFGASSFVAQELIKNINNTKILAFSRKKITSNAKNIKYFKTNYNEVLVLKEIKKFINHKDAITFIFFNAVSDKSAFFKKKKTDILKIIKINLSTPILITNMIIKNFIGFNLNFIYMSSARGHLGDKGISIYSTTKNALAAFTKNMSLEYASLGLNFRIILLGLFNGGLKDKINKKNIIKNILSRSSISKYITINQLLKTIRFIQNDKAGNGSVVYCDNDYN